MNRNGMVVLVGTANDAGQFPDTIRRVAFLILLRDAPDEVLVMLKPVHKRFNKLAFFRSDAVSSVPDVGRRTVLYGAYPNPFNPRTTIAFELTQQTVVNLFVFDVAGRLIRVLLDGEAVAKGRREIAWDGRDDSGQWVAAGVYFCRLDAGEYSETRRMALVK